MLEEPNRGWGWRRKLRQPRQAFAWALRSFCPRRRPSGRRKPCEAVLARLVRSRPLRWLPSLLASSASGGRTSSFVTLAINETSNDLDGGQAWRLPTDGTPRPGQGTAPCGARHKAADYTPVHTPPDMYPGVYAPANGPRYTRPLDITPGHVPPVHTPPDNAAPMNVAGCIRPAAWWGAHTTGRAAANP